MALINVSGPYNQVYNILRTLLHEGTPTGLRFFGPTKSAIGGLEEVAILVNGWWHKQEKNPVTGAITEVVKISELAPLDEATLKRAEGFDITYNDNTFVRYTFDAKAQKKPISHAWVMTVTPSKGDKRELHPVTALTDSTDTALTDNTNYLIGY